MTREPEMNGPEKNAGNRAGPRRWMVNKQRIGEWEVGFCRIPGQTWLRIWVRLDDDAYTAHVVENGNITFREGEEWTEEALAVLMRAYIQRDVSDPFVKEGCAS